MLWGLVGSQLGDVDVPMTGFGTATNVTVSNYLADVFDIKMDFIWWCTLVLAAWCIACVSEFCPTVSFSRRWGAGWACHVAAATQEPAPEHHLSVSLSCISSPAAVSAATLKFVNFQRR